MAVYYLFILSDCQRDQQNYQVEFREPPDRAFALAEDALSPRLSGWLKGTWQKAVLTQIWM